jgi:UDP-N-acetylglucosamine 2-epimerase (non-hydrolysing)
MMMSSTNIMCVVGARPNYMKMAPILRALEKNEIPLTLIHTGQHYDPEMNDQIFSDLDLRKPDINLNVGSGTHAIQTAEIMRRFEPLVDELKPSAVLVVGDVNSTIACALVAAKKRVHVIHVEAGLRSFDRGMPEEINRVLTDQLSDLLFITESGARNNLLREGIDDQRIIFVGNVMIDSLMHALPHAKRLQDILGDEHFLHSIGESQHGYGLVTLHRPSNVDPPEILSHLLRTLQQVSSKLPLIFAVHPRTWKNIVHFNLNTLLGERIIVTPPKSYLEMVGLMANATVILTDSGGMQEEATALSVPCLTLRNNTERPITVEQGTNTLVGQDTQFTLACIDSILANGGKRGCQPELWDGHAAERIASYLVNWLAEKTDAY